MTDVRTGSAESESVSADLAARNLQQRLMTCGHERPEGHCCPICYLYVGLPMSERHAKINFCCMKRVCNGCILAANQRGLGNRCEFCRTAYKNDDTSKLAMVQKRVDKGDAEANKFLGIAKKFCMIVDRRPCSHRVGSGSTIGGRRFLAFSRHSPLSRRRRVGGRLHLTLRRDAKTLTDVC